MVEDYTKAKTLATLVCHGEPFRIVRRRIRGKPANGMVMVHGATFVAPLKDGIALADLVEGLSKELAKNFPTRDSLQQSLHPILARYKFNP